MNVLVTGATGFVGAALIPRLQAGGHTVRAYARRPEAVAPGIEVVQGDAITTALPDVRYSAVTCFSMLHHMESPDDQDRLFARLYDLLRPGAALLGTDPLDTEFIREAHIDDTCVLVDPDTLVDRLQAAGFTGASVVQAGEHQFRFTATRPA